MTCGDPNCNQAREAKMVVIKRAPHGQPTVWCDPCIAPIVKALSDAGIGTVWSCCGHGRIPGAIGLADGRQLMILPTLDALKAITTRGSINDTPTQSSP